MRHTQVSGGYFAAAARRNSQTTRRWLCSACLRGVPRLAAAPGSTPGLGNTFTMQADNLPGLPGVTVLLLGFDLVSFGPGLLPFALDPLRLQCLLWLAPVSGAGLLRLHPGAAQAAWAMPIPNPAALSGLVLGAPGLALDVATPSGFALSNGVILQLH